MAYKRIAKNPQAIAAMRVRCPHCHSPIEVVDEISLAKIDCPSCGSRFSLIGGDTTETYRTDTHWLGQFELVRELGVGRFGSVWMARDTELDRTVAVKIPRKALLTRGKQRSFCAMLARPLSLSTPTLSVCTRWAASTTQST